MTLMSLNQAVEMINNGSLLCFSGNLMYRIPAAFVREIARQKKKDLIVMKTAGGYDIDLLCAFNCVKEVRAGFVSFEGFGLAKNFRRAVEEGKVKFAENTCYTVIASLRAAAYGVPFMPIVNISKSYFVEERGFKWVENPYSDGKVLTVPATKPDFAVIHVQKADKDGNALIYGPWFEDVLMCRAAKNIIITAEMIVPKEELRREIDVVWIPSYKVKAVVEVPKGAYPGCCPPYYDIDFDAVKNYLGLDKDGLVKHIKEIKP
ncbi:CoA transferase subunit A [Archaeoglobales archaeon]|nr:MAG: CoA transferase subunit A [Archaeoglobales archaeon]